MNYVVRALKVFLKTGGNTGIEDYEREVPNYTEALKEVARLRSLGHYNNISIRKIKKIIPTV